MSYNEGYWDSIDLTSGESTIPRRAVGLSTVPTINNLLRLTYFVARKGETITQVRTVGGATTQVGSTLIRIGVYSEDASGNLTLVASTANTTSLYAAVNTAYTTALSASFAKTRGTRYAVGILIVGSTTAPTVNGNQMPIAGSETAVSPRLSGVVTVSDLPSTIAVGTIGDSSIQHYAVLVP
jgi:hypothetical protein